MKIAVKVEGQEAILKRLENVQSAVRNKLLRRAVNAATLAPYKAAKANAKTVSNQAAANDLVAQANKSTGTLAKSMGRKVKIYRQSGAAVGIVGPRKGFARTVRLKTGREVYMDPVKYAHLVEFGTRRSRAKPVMRPAWDSTKVESGQAMTAILKDGIEEAAKA